MPPVVAPDLRGGVVPPLAGRLTPPRLGAHFVQRDRLLRLLSSLPEPAVYVVHAPPGYGKSTLIGHFAQTDARRVAWLTLDEQDADPVKLIRDVVFALSDGDETVNDLLERVAAGPATVVPAALPRLTRLIADRHENTVIVLDDVHHLTSREANDVLTALVDAVPDGSTLVLAGRVRPDLPIARLVASGRMAMIGARDLRMTVGEGRAMLNVRGITVDDEEAELLVTRTEGWPAALYLVSHALKDGRRPNEVTDAPEAELIDYFRDEVLRDVDADNVRFLLDSSILEELSPAACDRVLARSDSADRLASLAGADLFGAPLDAQHTSYRIHGLFREALQQRLSGSEPGRATELHRRAADHYAGAGDIESAVRHAIAAGDTKLAADLVWCAGPLYEANGRTATVRRWLELFSPEDFDANPCLALAAGWVAIDAGDGPAAEHWTTVALSAPPDHPLASGEPMAASAQLLDAALGKRGVAQVRAAAEAADRLFPDANPLKAVAKLLTGAAAFVGDDLDRARGLLFDSQARSSSSLGSTYGVALALLALIAIDEGDWGEAEAYMERARLVDRSGLQDYTIRSMRRAVDALIGAHRGEQVRAREAAADAKRALAAHRHYAPWFAAQARVVLAEAFVQLEWPAEARRMVAEAHKLVDDDPDAVRLHRCLERLDSEVGRGTGSISGREALSTAELRTLQYLQTHLMQKEIAERLHVTRNTVHTHTSAIYRKLGATSRAEAVQAARRLSLLDA